HPAEPSAGEPGGCADPPQHLRMQPTARTPRWHPRAGSDAFLDARLAAGEFAQVVQLGTAHVSTTLHLDVGDGRAVGLEHALHALAVRVAAHGERRMQAAVALGDHYALEGLQPL